MNVRTYRQARWLLLCCSLFPTRAALAQSSSSSSSSWHEADAPEHEPEPRGHEPTSTRLALRLTALEILEPELAKPELFSETPLESEGSSAAHVQRAVGLALAVEQTLVPGWLQLEVAAIAAAGGEGLTLPVDVFLDVPLELSHRLEATVGVGLASEWLLNGEYEPAFGVGWMLGASYWLSPEVGLSWSWEYSTFFSHGIEHELALGGGVITRL